MSACVCLQAITAVQIQAYHAVQLQAINVLSLQAFSVVQMPQNTAGINGTGVLLTLMVKRQTDGPASLQVMEAGSRNSRQKLLPVKIVQGSVTIP
jgi:hypothetical protein